MSRFTIRKRRGGFTLIEIMIVVLIISVLLAIAIPNFMRARETSRAKSCCANLRQIETAKEQWAMDNKASDGAATTMDALAPDYIKQTPVCPSSGEYTTSPVGDNALCSIAANGEGDFDDHALPAEAAAAGG